MTESTWIWIRIRRRIAHQVAGILREASNKLHFDASKAKGPKAEGLRSDADDIHYIGKQIERDIHYNGEYVNDESVHGNSAPVQITRFSLPKDARELMVSVVVAASILTNLVLWSKLHDAEKDIQTQVWLRDDALTKFQQGPFADLKAHVIANEINCKKE